MCKDADYSPGSIPYLYVIAVLSLGIVFRQLYNNIFTTTPQLLRDLVWDIVEPFRIAFPTVESAAE